MNRKEYDSLEIDQGWIGTRTALWDTLNRDLEQGKVSIANLRMSCSKSFLRWLIPFLKRNDLEYKVFKGINWKVLDEVVLYVYVKSDDPKKEIKEMAMVGGFMYGASTNEEMKSLIRKTEELMKLDLETIKVIISIMSLDKKVEINGKLGNI